ncbi:MAG: GNAT family N-acetyltransferase [Candidatus Cloacimonadota bacterium]|nr:GNAT family N-acetyltransferase [Candidatus Cloacimonadota bacterium]
MKTNIKIVEYKKEFAAGVADMWNRSSEGWQGDHWNKTEESVRAGEETSPFLKIWLAISPENEVIGYCDLLEYDNDEETWYVGLLNVRPDYFGKKIGKELLLKAINYSIKQKIPRVDLYTWPGNLKAIPLYKKCGYFWVNRDGSTHLINLIPKILKQELFQEFFSKADWYKDSTRKIEVVPDGRKEDEFEYWTYSWEKEEEFLEIELCRRGRGIRKIETNDYKITATIENRKLIFGSDYSIKYEFENRSGKPLEIAINSKNNKMIKFDFKDSFVVENIKVIEPKFFIDKITDVEEEEKTQPNVISGIMVNGKSILFETGISPQYPVGFSIQKNNFLFKNTENECWISVENMAKEDIELTAKLQNDGNISFKDEEIKMTLKSKEKNTIKSGFFFKNTGKYQNEVEFIIIKNGKQFSYKRDIELFVKTPNDKLYASTKASEFISNGKFHFSLMKKREKNCMFFGHGKGGNGGFFFPVPSLGKPYNNEFSKVTPKFESSQDENSISAKITFESKKFLGAKLIYNFELFQTGHLIMNIEIDKGLWQDELSNATYIWYPKNDSTCLVDGKVLQIPENAERDSLSMWNYDKIEENWIMSKDRKGENTFTIVWNDDFKFKGGDWKNVLENTIQKEVKTFESKEINFFINVFDNINSVREFALQKKVEKVISNKTTEYLINSGNPFVENKLNFQIRNNAESKLSGKFEISSDVFQTQKQEFADKKQIVEFDNVELKNLQNVNILELDCFENGVSNSRKVVFFKKENKEITLVERSENDKKVMTISNGIIELSVSPDFAPVVYSMKYKGKEWLDTLYPNPGPKSWWNPWAGGMYFRNIGLKLKTILKEKNSFEFVTKVDQFGNNWQGFAMTTEFLEYEKFKGISVTQYFLLLAGSSVIAKFVICKNKSGFRVNQRFYNRMFFKTDSVQDTYFQLTTDSKAKIKVQGGISEIGFDVKIGKVFNHTRDEKSFLTSPIDGEKLHLSANSEVLESYIYQKNLIENGETKVFKPSFVIFSKDDIDNSRIEMLKRIEFG